MRYCAFGRVIESERPLPELPRASSSDAPRFVVTSQASVAFPRGLRWSVVWPAAAAEPEVSFARGDDGVFLRFGRVLSAAIADRRIALAADASVDPAAVRHLLLDQILPLALAAAGETVLHASAVRVDNAAVLFVGHAGAGKSTVAAAISGCGAAVLADDGVLLDARGAEVRAVPSYPGLRLWPDAAEFASARGFAVEPLSSGTEKRRLVPRGDSAPPPVLPLWGVYSLDADAVPGFTRLSRRDAALEIVRHAFTPGVETRAAVREHLDRAAGWAGRIDVWRAAASRDFAALEPFARAILAHVRSRHASARLQDR